MSAPHPVKFNPAALLLIVLYVLPFLIYLGIYTKNKKQYQQQLAYYNSQQEKYGEAIERELPQLEARQQELLKTRCSSNGSVDRTHYQVN